MQRDADIARPQPRRGIGHAAAQVDLLQAAAPAGKTGRRVDESALRLQQRERAAGRRRCRPGCCRGRRLHRVGPGRRAGARLGAQRQAVLAQASLQLELGRVDRGRALERGLRQRQRFDRALRIDRGVGAALELPAQLRAPRAGRAELQVVAVELALCGDVGPATARARRGVDRAGERRFGGGRARQSPQRRQCLQRRRGECRLPLVDRRRLCIGDAAFGAEPVAGGVELQRQQRGRRAVVAQCHLALQRHAGELAALEVQPCMAAPCGDALEQRLRVGGRGQAQLELALRIQPVWALAPR